MAGVKALQQSCVQKLPEGKPFRFVSTSGGAVPYLDSNLLFFMGEKRKLRVSFGAVQHIRDRTDLSLQGDIDREVLALEKQDPARWQSFVVRPWYVATTEPSIRYIFGNNSFILQDHLGAAMVDVALNGGNDRIIDNAELKRRGQATLEKLS